MSIPQLNFYTSDELQALLKAASECDLITLAELMRDNANINAVGTCGDGSNEYNPQGGRLWTMLTIAAYHRQDVVIGILHSRGADMDFHPYGGETALMTAAREGHAEIFATLHRCGADVNLKRLDGASVLHEAVADVSPINLQAKVAIMDILLNNNFPIDRTDDAGNTALHLAALIGSLPLVIYLIKHNAGKNAKNGRNASPLDKAASKGHTDVIRFLLSEGARVNSTEGGCAGLGHAVDNGDGSVVTLLLGCGAKRIPNNPSRSELLRAARSGNVSMTQELAARGFADQAAEAVREAVLRDGADVVELLLDLGLVDLNKRDYWGQRLLHSAVLSKEWESYPRIDVIALLLRRGADVKAKNFERQTAKDLAIAKGFTAAVDLLHAHER